MQGILQYCFTDYWSGGRCVWTTHTGHQSAGNTHETHNTAGNRAPARRTASEAIYDFKLFCFYCQGLSSSDRFIINNIYIVLFLCSYLKQLSCEGFALLPRDDT